MLPNCHKYSKPLFKWGISALFARNLLVLLYLESLQLCENPSLLWSICCLSWKCNVLQHEQTCQYSAHSWVGNARPVSRSLNETCKWLANTFVMRFGGPSKLGLRCWQRSNHISLDKQNRLMEPLISKDVPAALKNMFPAHSCVSQIIKQGKNHYCLQQSMDCFYFKSASPVYSLL